MSETGDLSAYIAEFARWVLFGMASVARSPESGWLVSAHVSMTLEYHYLGFGSMAFPGLKWNYRPSSRGLVRCEHGAAVSRGRVSLRSRSSNHKYEKLWRTLCSDPSEWWDNRTGKPNSKFPDFKHEESEEGLWVALEIASIIQGVNVCLWPQKLSRHNKAGQYKKTLELFEQMQHSGISADCYVFVHVLNACAALQDLEAGKCIHRQIIENGCDLNLYVSNSLIDMYAKCGSMGDAWVVFDRMPTRDVVTWNGIILVCVKSGERMKALELYRQMQREGIEPNSVTFVRLLSACDSLEALKDGKFVHRQIILSGCESNLYVGKSLDDMYAKCALKEDEGTRTSSLSMICSNV